MRVLHVASIKISPNSGMGRIAYHWKLALERQGIEFVHIGWEELGKSAHPLLFGWLVRKYIIKNKLRPDIILAHEPAAGFLMFKGIPLIVFSHGIEERGWEQKMKYKYELSSFKAKLIPRIVRFFSNNYGFKKATKILLSNTLDREYLINRKMIPSHKLFIFRNGYYKFETHNRKGTGEITCLFNATWIERKGVAILINVFSNLLLLYPHLKLRIAGTGISSAEVLDNFSSDIHSQIEVYTNFSAETESVIYENADIFLLPSFFEGQSLALTQAMSLGLCPIAAKNCGQVDFIQDGINGRLFDTGDSEQFKEVLCEVLKNGKYDIEMMGKQAKKSVKELTWSLVSDETAALIKAACTNGN